MSCLAERFIYLPLFYLVLEEQKASTVLIGTADGAVVEVVLNFANLLGFEKGHQQLKFFGTQRSMYLKFTKSYTKADKRQKTIYEYCRTSRRCEE